MSDIDLTAACEVVARQLYGDIRSPRAMNAAVNLVRPTIEAAAPIIEAAVREQITAAIEHAAQESTRIALLPRTPSPYRHEGDTFRAAARIARGES